uniref:Uncharacterized protein n=1 Tax=Picea sitchensis TaxID=3332 RepID=D5ADU5_PICSI|nr:unknown [Picea sitchensis]
MASSLSCSPSPSSCLQKPSYTHCPTCPAAALGRLQQRRCITPKRRLVVRMAPDEEKMTKRSPLDFPLEWDRPRPGRRPDIFPQFSPMKTPLPPPLPADPPFEEDEEDEEKKEEEEDPDKEPENPEE